MSFEASLLVAFFIIVTSLVVVLILFGRRRMLAKEDEFKRAAATRGWTFDKKHEGGYRIYTFTGTTDGVAWRAESATRVSGDNKRHRRRRIARWHGKWSPGIAAPIVAMGVPKGKEQMGPGLAQGDGFVARMAQQAAGFAFDQALDAYFGKDIGAEIDARQLKRVESAAVPGFIVMAGDTSEASRVLSEGLQRALLDATNDSGNVLSDNDRPYVLVRSDGISLARMDRFLDVAEVERFVRAGIALTRAFRFGRPA